MGAGDAAKLIEILGGVALIYVGLANLVWPLFRAISTHWRGVAREELQHLARAGLFNLGLGVAALILGAALMSSAFTGGNPRQNLTNGVHDMGAVVVVFLPVLVLAVLAAIAYRVFRVDFAVRRWTLPIAVIATAAEIYLITEYLVQRSPTILFIAIIFAIPLALRWFLVATRSGHP